MTNIFDFEFQIICRMIAAEFPVENLIKNRDLTQTFYALAHVILWPQTVKSLKIMSIFMLELLQCFTALLLILNDPHKSSYQ